MNVGDAIGQRSERGLCHGDKNLRLGEIRVKILSQSGEFPCRDKSLSPGTLADVTTLGDRIQYILDRVPSPSGEKWNAKSLSQAAGLPSDAHVGMLKRGTVKTGRGDTLAKIASAARVSLRWLSTGEGSPTDDDNESRAPGGESSEPKFANIPHWDHIRATAKTLEPSIEDWALDIVAQSHPMLTAPLTPGMVVDLARVVMKHCPRPAGVSSPGRK